MENVNENNAAMLASFKKVAGSIESRLDQLEPVFKDGSNFSKMVQELGGDMSQFKDASDAFGKLYDAVHDLHMYTVISAEGDKEEIKEKAKNPYAIGMAAAMKATGDEPPLEKSTIVKAHDIAKKIDTKESDNDPDQEVMEWMERFKKLG